MLANRVALQQLLCLYFVPGFQATTATNANTAKQGHEINFGLRQTNTENFYVWLPTVDVGETTSGVKYDDFYI